MKAIWRNRANDTITTTFGVYSKVLHGKRIDALIIESWEEAREISSPKGMDWFSRCVVPSFRLKPKEE